MSKRRERFYSDEAPGRHEAMEGACDDAILHLRKQYFVLVDDINHREVKASGTQGSGSGDLV